MRAVVVASLIALLSPAVACAQGAPVKPPAGGDSVTKNQYVEQARERAAKRFDKLDANRDGTLSAEERRGARPKKRAPQ